MSGLNFEITIHGGKADEPMVDASSIGKMMEFLSKDIESVCRNLSAADAAVPWKEKRESCRLYVASEPKKGKSLSILFHVGGEASWGAESGLLYLGGLAEIRESVPTSVPSLPRGFDIDILRSGRRITDLFMKDRSSVYASVPANGRPPIRVDFDSRLARHLDIAIGQLEATRSDAKHSEDKQYGYQIEGFLFGLRDPQWFSKSAKLSFEVDTQDGTVWVCNIKRKKLPPDFEKWWHGPVAVEGVATFRPERPKLEVASLRRIPKMDDPVAAAKRLAQSCAGMLGDDSLEEVMDEIRERRE